MISFTIRQIIKIFKKKYEFEKKNIFSKINLNKNKLCIIDIGGAGGIQLRWKNFKQYIRVIFIEPDERSYIDLKKNKFEVINKALWSNKGIKDFYLTKKFQTSSIYKPNREYLDQFPDSNRFDIVDIKKINVSKLDDIVNHDTQPHFLKLDIQGAELEVLKGGKNTLSKVLGLEVELNFKEIYKNIPLAHQVENYLINQGFYLNDYLTFFKWNRVSYNGYGEVIFGDGLFLRTPEKVIEEASKNKEMLSIYENYIKILFCYNKLDIIIKFSELISEEHKKLLELNILIKFLNKYYRRINILNKFLYSINIKPIQIEI